MNNMEYREQMDLARQDAKSETPGLTTRLRAAKMLEKVLQGSSFEPLGPADVENSRDRALTNRLVTTALRRRGHTDQVIGALLSRGLPARSGLFEAVLRLGLTQVLFMPDQADHSALHLSVEVLRRDRRAARYDRLLNGVLRQAQREREKWQSLEPALLFPEWLQAKWSAQYGPENLGWFAKALLEGAPLDLTLKKSDAALVEALGGSLLTGDSVRIETRDRPVDQLPGYGEGAWWVQDMAAAMPAGLLALPLGARVLDMCAAPGGKTAQLVKAGYEVAALDNDKARLLRLQKNLTRLNYRAELVEGDACTYRGKEQFDGILLDAPCSATGTFRRHPELVWHRRPRDIAGRVALQRQMISNAVANLDDGGVLVYCVCSLQSEEGEGQAEWVLHNFPQLKNDPLPTSALNGLERFVGDEGFLRTHPGHEVQAGAENKKTRGSMDGFFAARFRKGQNTTSL